MNADSTDVDAAAAAAHTPALFVIWHAAAGHHDRILADLGTRFQVLNVYEIRWTPAYVMQNYQRFYSDLDVRGAYHIFNKGSGPLTAVTVLDPEPRVEVGKTARGLRPVNIHFFEAKQRYREWTRGLHVHCSETPAETRRDTMMLLGTDIASCTANATRPRNDGTQRLDRDLIGVHGWSSLGELFAALNQCTRYAVLYQRDTPPGSWAIAGQDTVELITEDLFAMHRILNARPAVQAKPNGGQFKVLVGGTRMPIAIRFPGDQYFDPAWAQAMLADRVYDDAGYYRLADVDFFDTLAYHALVHRSSPAAFRTQLRTAADCLQRADWSSDLPNHPQRSAAWLNQKLQQRGYRWYQPLDVSVGTRRPLPADQGPHWSAERAGVPARLAARAQRLAGTGLGGWFAIRDRVLLRLRWLRPLKRMLSRGAAKTAA